MRAAWLLAIAIVATGPACLRQTEFHCTSSSECNAGRCEPQGFCRFADPTCNGYRFGDSAGAYANQCVNAIGGDAGVDGRVDAPVIDAFAGCPAQFNQLPGGSAHRYLVIGAGDNWITQRDACGAMSSSAYLTIPDDATELQALSLLSGASGFWVGVDDLTTESMFVTVHGTPAQYLPWAAGQPDNSGPGEEDCVETISASSLFDDKKCNIKLPAICECDP